MRRRTLNSLLIALLLCIPLNAQTRPDERTRTVADSVFVFSYPACIQMFKVRYKENLKTLRLLRQRLQTFTQGKDTIYVNGFSGRCGSRPRNLNTAFRRCNNLKGYLIDTAGLRERDFKTANIPFAHPQLGEVVLMSFAPYQWEAHKNEKEKNNKAKDDLLQPSAVADESTDSAYTPEKPKTNPQKQPRLKEEISAMPENNRSTVTNPLPADTWTANRLYLGVKTNLAAWAGTIMNIAADLQVSKHISVELPLLWCPWYVSDTHAVKTFTMQPEARYWLSKPGSGHFFGLHAHVSWFNVRWNRDRYQDTGRPLLGAGISYGYLLTFNGRWAGEFTLGAGYANMKYETYYNIDNGARIGTSTKNYWGITRVGISVVYRFNLKK